MLILMKMALITNNGLFLPYSKISMSLALFFSIIGRLGTLLLSMIDIMSTLDNSQTYSCPLCFRGEIRAFPLMDAFGCDFWLVSRIFRAGSNIIVISLLS